MKTSRRCKLSALRREYVMGTLSPTIAGVCIMKCRVRVLLFILKFFTLDDKGKPTLKVLEWKKKETKTFPFSFFWVSHWMFKSFLTNTKQCCYKVSQQTSHSEDAMLHLVLTWHIYWSISTHCRHESCLTCTEFCIYADRLVQICCLFKHHCDWLNLHRLFV